MDVKMIDDWSANVLFYACCIVWPVFVFYWWWDEPNSPVTVDDEKKGFFGKLQGTLCGSKETLTGLFHKRDQSDKTLLLQSEDQFYTNWSSDDEKHKEDREVSWKKQEKKLPHKNGGRMWRFLSCGCSFLLVIIVFLLMQVPDYDKLFNNERVAPPKRYWDPSAKYLVDLKAAGIERTVKIKKDEVEWKNAFLEEEQGTSLVTYGAGGRPPFLESTIIDGCNIFKFMAGGCENDVAFIKNLVLDEGGKYKWNVGHCWIIIDNEKLTYHSTAISVRWGKGHLNSTLELSQKNIEDAIKNFFRIIIPFF